MGRCGCEGTTCGCKVKGSGNAIVTGSGTAANPYDVNVTLAMIALSTGSVGLQLLGSGTEGDPWILSGSFAGALDDLIDVDTAGGATGDVLARLADGSYALVPPVTATPGAIGTDTSLDGDGSGGDLLKLRLAPNSGLAVSGSGTYLDPFIATSEALLNVEWGSVLPGTIVALANGSAVWIKTASGWADIIEDTGTVATTAGNITAASGWTVNSFLGRRRNGMVAMQLQITSTVARVTSVDNGNIANIAVATIVPAHFRPVIPTAFRVNGAGDDSGFYLATTGALVLTNLAQPDVTLPAGYVWTIASTFMGA